MDRRGGAAPRPHGRHRLCLDGSNTVFSDDLVNGEVKGLDLGADSVGSGKVADGSVKNADLSTGASSSNTIADGGIQSIDVKDDTLTAADLAPVQSPIQPQLENCAGSTQWIGAPAQAEQPAFWKDPFGVVHLEGAVGCPDNADEGTVIFNFPPGYGPPLFTVLRYGALGGGQTLVQLATTSDFGGARLVYDGPDGDAIDDYISLDGITFRTEG